MPRRRQAAATERARDRRFIYQTELKRFLRLLRRNFLRYAHYKISRVFQSHRELRELVLSALYEYARATVEGRRMPMFSAWLRLLAEQIMPESARKDLERLRRAREAIERRAAEDPRVWDAAVFYNPTAHGEALAVAAAEAIALDWRMRATLRRERTPEPVRTVLTNETRVSIVERNRPAELVNDPWAQLLYATLWTHPVCTSSHGLAFFDQLPGQRVYHVVNYHKENHGVVATMGAFEASLAAVAADDDKPENETIPLTLDTQVDFTDTNQLATIATNDTGDVQIAYPLYFAMERPSRVEAWRARNMGRREERDNIIHCSFYRLMVGGRRAKWKTVRYKGRVIRITVRLPRTVLVE